MFLGNAKYFSGLDLHTSYFQLLVDPASWEYTTIQTPLGSFQFVGVPFGAKNAPAAFSRLMNRVLAPFLGKFVLVYLDDILIYSETWADHMEHVRLVLQALQNEGLFAKFSKCEFSRTEIDYCGYRLAQGTIGCL